MSVFSPANKINLLSNSVRYCPSKYLLRSLANEIYVISELQKQLEIRCHNIKVITSTLNNRKKKRKI